MLGEDSTRGILKKDGLRRNLRIGILVEGPWQKDSRRGSGATSKEPWRIIQGPSGATNYLREVTRTSFWAERKGVLKPFYLSAEGGASDLLACTGTRQHARSTAPANKSWRA